MFFSGFHVTEGKRRGHLMKRGPKVLEGHFKGNRKEE